MKFRERLKGYNLFISPFQLWIISIKIIIPYDNYLPPPCSPLGLRQRRDSAVLFFTHQESRVEGNIKNEINLGTWPFGFELGVVPHLLHKEGLIQTKKNQKVKNKVC